METRHSKRKQMSVHERMTRRHKSNIRVLKMWCEDRQIPWYDYNNAPSDSICAVSTSDYDIGDPRSVVAENNDSYFINSEDYESWCESS